MGLSYKNDYRYAGSRLRDSIVSHNGLPVYVMSVDNDGLCRLYNTEVYGERDYGYVPLDELDLTPINLGYVNADLYGFGEKRAYFIQRTPKRRDWRQGLRETSLIIDGEGSRAGVAKLLSCLTQTMKGDYPSIDDACSMLDKGSPIVAFSRKFAISSDGALMYKRHKVGTLNKLTKEVLLLDNFFFLKEFLEEALNEKAA